MCINAGNHSSNAGKLASFENAVFEAVGVALLQRSGDGKLDATV
ncbi:hypothetical protein ACZ87_03294 [Candidatus Erwinia dacicola]|uniref:Uncharacterized protein n=1 Tax=Candidatus Erwinia dacicola TaxID=252393 RepID=A0A328TKR9_9GAMM|nr:hypothetical protein ACZ87_03294 [Candidatus Erwinia dacicola]